MKRTADKPRPTDAELQILRVLWSRGPSTVREIQQDLGGDGATGYTTVLKLLQIMTEKRLVEREEVGRAHRYRAAQPAEQTQSGLVRDLMERAFGGSAQELVLRALASKPTSPEELAEIRRLIDALERERHEG
jgi:predicted transcriptional regulator